MLRAVIFDMDETLVDWSQHTADWDEVRERQIQPAYDYLKQAGHRLPSLREVAVLFNTCNHTAWMSSTAPDWPAPRQIDVLAETCRALGVPASQDDLHQLQRMFFWGPIPGVRVFPDAYTVLQILRQAGLRTGLMTNASSPMWMRDRELAGYGLLEYLDVRMTAGDIGHLKPHRRAFEAVLEGLDVGPEEAIFVGDRLFDDISGAQAVGMRAVWVRRISAMDGDGGSGSQETYNGIQPNATIESLSELLDTLDQWHPGWR